MSSNNVAHVASVDKGLKMKIKRTKGPNRVESKHEVVKSDPLSKLATTLSGQSTTVTSLSSTSVPLSIALSAVNANGEPTISAAGMHTATASSSLTLSSTSSSSIISSSSTSSFMPSSGTMVATNPTVTHQKAGILPHGYSISNPANCSRSPLKAISSATSGQDSKELKSPKAKAAYNKKAKDNKGKIDGPTVGSNFTANGPCIPNADTRTSIGISSGSQAFNPAPTPFTSQAGVNNSTMTSEPRPGDTVHVKRENPVHDPYEFNAKVEDKIELPPKKLKLEKTDCIETAISPDPQPQQHTSPPIMLHPPKQQQQQLQQHHQQQQQQTQKRSVGVDVRSIGVLTEPESLGPCEPGTQVGLEGIVWKETDNGLLVVNVTWRGKTYVGTLMDATRYAWAPPRPNGCDSPVSDFDTRTPKGRGKRNCRTSVQTNEKLPEGRRLRKGRRGTVNSSSSNFTAPPSPAKSDVSCSSSLKRRNKPNDMDGDKAKKSRPCSHGATGAESPTPDGYIVCPEPNCQKKYKHMNGLRYHRTHAHRKSSLTDDTKDEDDDDEDDEEKSDKREKIPMSERSERMKLKERQRMKEQQMVPDRDSKDSLDDDIPLKEIASKATGQANAHKTDAVRASRGEELSNSNNVSSSCEAESAVPCKTDPQILFPNSDVSVQKEPASPASSAMGCKTKYSAVGDISDSSLTVVPSVSSISETTHSTVTNNTGIDLSSLTTALSHTYNSISTVPPSGISLASQASHNLSVVTTQTLPLKTSAARQTSSTTSTSVLGLTMTTDKQTNGRHSHSVKSISSSRPIVPTPSSQMADVNSPFSQTVNSGLFSHGHTPTLKPIQPKPAILRDYPVSSPVLLEPTKEKPRKSKKKKDHAETGTSAAESPYLKGLASAKDCSRPMLDVISQDDTYKSERTAVIKNASVSEQFDTSCSRDDVSKLAFHSSTSSSKQPCSVTSDLTATSGSRVIPPSTLSVYSSVDNKNMTTEDKMYDHPHPDKGKSPAELTSSNCHLSSSSPIASRNSFENKLYDLIPHDLIKKECVLSEDVPRLEPVNAKQFDTKDSISQLVSKSSSLEPAPKSRPPSQSSTPGIPQLSSAPSSSPSLTASLTVPSSLQSSSSAAAAALPVSLVSSLPAAGTPFPYAPYYPHFRPVQMDTMYRALSPHIIGYTNGPHGYVHPGQLGYRVPLAETGKKSPDSVEPQRGDGPGLANNTGLNHAHKVHEQQEKGRPSPGVHSAASNNKSGAGDNIHSSTSASPDPAVEKVKDKQREYSNSPPTQRHVHTHHHTHVMSLYTPDTYSKLMKF
ncbi:unnamed protein product [Candidula unifasciata]|uniref:C2H2-type domain-containing protein n=1 Tax=Candidula unifasciata TaxID=100452 RepID=A0A8S4A3H1_9EUPU|nr:unnamed protein product [Candidula unifasciata]